MILVCLLGNVLCFNCCTWFNLKFTLKEPKIKFKFAFFDLTSVSGYRLSLCTQSWFYHKISYLFHFIPFMFSFSGQTICHRIFKKNLCTVTKLTGQKLWGDSNEVLLFKYITQFINST